MQVDKEEGMKDLRMDSGIPRANGTDVTFKQAEIHGIEPNLERPTCSAAVDSGITKDVQL